MSAMTSLVPPPPVSLRFSSSTRQPCRSAYRLYMRNKSDANSAASSPPVPARISRTTFFSSFGSFGTRRTLISASSTSRRASSEESSSCASSRMSGSFTSSSVAVICATTSLYSRKCSTSGWISASAFEWLRNLAVSPCTAGSAISDINWSYCASTALSLSNTATSQPLGTFAARHRRQERHDVAVAQRRREGGVVLVDGARDGPLVVGQRGELLRER